MGRDRSEVILANRDLGFLRYPCPHSFKHYWTVVASPLKSVEKTIQVLKLLFSTLFQLCRRLVAGSRQVQADRDVEQRRG
jgi:hypothetical protein